MSLPVPQPGLVIRYAYLWRREFLAEREHGAKDRPCAIVLAVEEADGGIRTYAIPITHTEPSTAEEAIEIPAAVKNRLGLDSARSWVVVTEANVFIWPGPDLRAILGDGPASVAYGFLPPRLLRRIRDSFLDLARARKIQVVKRTR